MSGEYKTYPNNYSRMSQQMKDLYDQQTYTKDDNIFFWDNGEKQGCGFVYTLINDTRVELRITIESINNGIIDSAIRIDNYDYLKNSDTYEYYSITHVINDSNPQINIDDIKSNEDRIVIAGVAQLCYNLTYYDRIDEYESAEDKLSSDLICLIVTDEIVVQGFNIFNKVYAYDASFIDQYQIISNDCNKVLCCFWEYNNHPDLQVYTHTISENSYFSNHKIFGEVYFPDDSYTYQKIATENSCAFIVSGTAMNGSRRNVSIIQCDQSIYTHSFRDLSDGTVDGENVGEHCVDIFCYIKTANIIKILCNANFLTTDDYYDESVIITASIGTDSEPTVEVTYELENLYPMCKFVMSKYGYYLAKENKLIELTSDIRNNIDTMIYLATDDDITGSEDGISLNSSIFTNKYDFGNAKYIYIPDKKILFGPSLPDDDSGYAYVKTE